MAKVELKLPNKGEPIQVQIADSHRRALWRLLRSATTMLIMVAGVTVFAEGLAGNVQKALSLSFLFLESGQGFGMGSKKITPVEESYQLFASVILRSFCKNHATCEITASQNVGPRFVICF